MRRARGLGRAVGVAAASLSLACNAILGLSDPYVKSDSIAGSSGASGQEAGAAETGGGVDTSHEGGRSGAGGSVSRGGETGGVEGGSPGIDALGQGGTAASGLGGDGGVAGLDAGAGGRTPVPSAIVAESETVRLVRGKTASLNLHLLRDGFDDALSVSVNGLPKGVSVDPLTIEPTQTTAALAFEATSAAALGAASLTITALGGSLSTALRLIVQDPPGMLDATFGVAGKFLLPASGYTRPGNHGLAFQSNGRIIVCGNVTTLDGGEALLLAGVTPAGEHDATFGTRGSTLVNSVGSSTDMCHGVVVLPSSDKIAVAGFSTPAGHEFMTGRFTANGAPDPTFGGSAGTGLVRAVFSVVSDAKAAPIVVQPDGKLVVGGFGGPSSLGTLVRYLSDGTPDATFGTEGVVEGLPGAVNSLRRQSTGALVAALIDTYSRAFILQRFTTDGKKDATFGMNGQTALDVGGEGFSESTDVLVQPDDALVLVGHTKGPSGDLDMAVARLTSDGDEDAGFGTNGAALAHFGAGDVFTSAAELDEDGGIVVVGSTPASEGTAYSVVRFTKDGALDEGFGDHGRRILDVSAAASSVAIDDLGRILVAGWVGNANAHNVVLYRLWP